MGLIRSSILSLGSLYDRFVTDRRRRKGATQPIIERGLVGHRKAITALKALNKPRDPRDFNKDLPDEIQEQFRYPGESDRSFIILNGSMLEDRLESVLRVKFSGLSSTEQSKLFGFTGPMTTFANKIRVAQALGIVTRTHAQQIDLVREMRNTAAHILTPITFDTPEIRAGVMCFLTEKQAESARANWDKMSFRTFYGMLCLNLDTHIWSDDPRIWTIEDLVKGVDDLARGEKGTVPFRLHSWLKKWL